MIHTPVQ